MKYFQYRPTKGGKKTLFTENYKIADERNWKTTLNRRKIYFASQKD